MTAILEPSTCYKLGQDLAVALASTYMLYLKTQNFHWNIEDPRFSQLHHLFQEQYEELAEQTDEIAERMRMLGQKSPGTMKFFLENSFIQEAAENLSGDEMIWQLAQDHQALSKWLLETIKKAQDLGDEGTADLYIQQLRAHDKQAWMLFSHHQKKG